MENIPTTSEAIEFLRGLVTYLRKDPWAQARMRLLLAWAEGLPRSEQDSLPFHLEARAPVQMDPEPRTPRKKVKS